MGTSWLDLTDMVAGACCAPFRLGSLIPTPAPSADMGCRQTAEERADSHYDDTNATATPLFIIIYTCRTLADCEDSKESCCYVRLGPVLSSI